jgi:outer membrane protein
MGFGGGKTQGKLEAALLGLFGILIPINLLTVNPKTGHGVTTNLKIFHIHRNVGILMFLIVSLILTFSLGLHAPKSVFGQQEPDHYYTLERAVQRALAADLGLKSAQEETKAAMARKNARQTEFFPTFNLTYQYVRHDDEQRVEDIGLIFPKNEYTFMAGFSQPLFTGFSILNRYKIAELSLQASRTSEEIHRQNIIFSAMEAYFYLLKTTKLREIAQETLAEIDAQKTVAENFYEVGMTALNDLLQAQVELANAQQTLVISQNDMETAEAYFNTVLRRPINAPVTAEDILDYETFEYDIEYCLAQAEKYRKEINLADMELQIAEKEFDIAKKDFFPSISLEGRYFQQGTEWDARGGLGVFGKSSGWEVAAVATWNIFEWGRTYFGAEEQLHRVSQVRLGRTQLLDNIRFEVKQAYLKMRESEKNIKTVELAIEQAKENFRINTEQYKEQIATQTDVLIAQTLLSRTRTNYYNALYDYEIAKAALYRAMGRFDSTDYAAIP